MILIFLIFESPSVRCFACSVPTPNDQYSDSRRRAPVERRGEHQISRDSQTESAAAVRCSALVRPRRCHHQNLRSKNPRSLEPNQAAASGSRARTGEAVGRSNSPTSRASQNRITETTRQQNRLSKNLERAEVA